jgi:hypothetical protein
MPADRELESLSRRIDALTAALEASTDAATRETARELVAALLRLHRAGMARMLEIVDHAGSPTRGMVEQFAADPLVASLLVLHDLHPEEVGARIERALVPVARMCGATLSVVSASTDTVHVRVLGPLNPRSDAGQVRRTIEEVAQAVAPSIRSIHVEGLALAPTGELLVSLARRSASTPAAVAPT